MNPVNSDRLEIEQEFEEVNQAILEEQNRIRSILRQISQEKDALRKLGLSSVTIRTHMQERLHKLQTDLFHIHANDATYEKEKAATFAAFQTTAAKIESTTLQCPSFRKKERMQQAVTCIGSKAILDFNTKDSRPKLLFISSERDKNGALSPSEPSLCKVLRKLNTAYDVKYIVVENVQDIDKQLRVLPKNYLSGIVINAHGEPNGILLNPKWDGAFADPSVGACFKNRAFVHLLSCSTGTSEIGPLKRMRDSLLPLNKEIIVSAPTSPIKIADMDILSTVPLVMRYKISREKCMFLEAVDMDFSVRSCRSMPELPNDFLDATNHLSTKEGVAKLSGSEKF